jgi:hypothetical protein
VNAGNISYRIRQVIDTASASFSAVYIDTVNVSNTVNCPGTTNPSSIVVVAPNPPLGETATLIIETNYAIENMPIAVYDMKGRLMMQLSKSKAVGKILIDIPIEKLARGKYIIRVNNGSKTVGKTTLLKL